VQPLPQPPAPLPAPFRAEHVMSLPGRPVIVEPRAAPLRRKPTTPAAVSPGAYSRGAFVSTSLLDKRETRIRRMFNSFAPRYDLLNHLLSLNIDRYWRWRTTRLVPPRGGAPILDVCTGTGDLALAYDR